MHLGRISSEARMGAFLYIGHPDGPWDLNPRGIAPRGRISSVFLWHAGASLVGLRAPNPSGFGGDLGYPPVFGFR